MSQVDFDAVPAYLELKAADEKNRRGSIIPLRADLVKELREFVAGRGVTPFTGKVRGRARHLADPSSPLFDVPNGLCNILNRDLAEAGIPKCDWRGRFVDVHALRHTFGTNLCRAGVPLRTAQAAMRHSDPKLTANVYTDPALLDVAGAVASLPSLPTVRGVNPTAGYAEKRGDNTHASKEVGNGKPAVA